MDPYNMLKSALPQISIVTPSFNQGKYLESTIQSVLGQGYKRLQYIIMDGGSTDNSLAIIKKYANKLSYWRSSPDDGQVAAIQEGFKLSDGELIGWLNADDMYMDGALMELAKAYCRQPNAGFYAGASVFIDTNNRILRNKVLLPRVIAPIHLLTEQNIIKQRVPFLQPGTLWRRSAYDQVGGLDPGLDFCFDRDLFIRLAKLNPGYSINFIVAAYRLHELSKTSTMQDVQSMEDKILKERYNSISNSSFGYLNKLVGAGLVRWQKVITALRYITGTINKPKWVHYENF